MSGTKHDAETGEPGRILSMYDRCRYRIRLIGYAITYLSRPKFYELVGLIVGLVGAASTLTILLSFFTNQPIIYPVVGSLILLALSLGYVSNRLAQIPHIMALAARTPEGTRRLQADMREGLGNNDAYQALERIYRPIVEEVNNTLAERGVDRAFKFMENPAGHQKALAVAMPANAGESLDALIDPHWKPRDRGWHIRASKSAPQRQAYMASLRNLKGSDTEHPFKDDEAGDNLILDDIDIDSSNGRLQLRVSIGTYGEIMRTSDALINEFTIYAYVGRDKSEELRAATRWMRKLAFLRWGHPIQLAAKSSLKQLPWRRLAHKQAPAPSSIFLNPTGRAAGLGVAVTLIKSDAPTATVYVSRRGKSVGTYADVRHVIPAGMCNLKDDIRDAQQPIPADFLQWTMLGELLEECYDESEFAGNRSDDWMRCIRDKCRELALSTESPEFTGLAFDLLNLRPEVCATVKVVDPGLQVPARSFKICWEYNPGTGVQAYGLKSILDTYERTDWVQSGIASLELASIKYNSDLETMKGC